jgi:putative hydrolase of the HAD superfamily
MPELRGLLVDYGGVLTGNVFASFAAFCERKGLDPRAAAHAFAADRDARRALVDFECGRLADADFERIVAERLGIAPDGLIAGLFGDLEPAHDMIAAVAEAHAAGIRTGLLSNSWGHGSYDRTGWDELFDVTVISGELGVRKPQPEIYAHAVELMELPADQIVFVDDLEQNLAPARELGMTVVLHRDAATTIPELERLFDALSHGGSEPGARS